jgi:hypothetical protein
MKPPPFNQKLWDDINTVIREAGGAIISPPGNRIKFVANADSDIPEVLRFCGHSVIPVGMEPRTGQANVAAFEFDISTDDKFVP